MRWLIDEAARARSPVDQIQILEVLYDFDGPRIFTCIDEGRLTLWYECADDEHGFRHLVVPADRALILKLKDGTRSLHDALNQAWLWAVDTDRDRDVVASWALVGLHAVPQNSKPLPDALLWKELEPLLTYRLLGDGLSEGHVPASVIARALTRPTAALKHLIEIVTDLDAQIGRPEEAFRRAYDLVAKRFAFNSFEVSLAGPAEAELPLTADGRTIYAAAGEKLAEAVQWLHAPEQHFVPSIELLEVMSDLMPPGSGVVRGAVVSGALIPGKLPFVLSRDDRRAVKQALDQARPPGLQTLHGRVGALDRDLFTLVLRDIEGLANDVKCTFEEELDAAFLEAFNTEQMVSVTGRLRGRRYMDVLSLATPVPQGLPPQLR